MEAKLDAGMTCTHIMIEQCADHMELISEHSYRGRLPWTQQGPVDRLTYVALMKDSIRKKAEGHRKLQASLPNLNGRVNPIAMDEWIYWHREYVYGEAGRMMWPPRLPWTARRLPWA